MPHMAYTYHVLVTPALNQALECDFQLSTYKTQSPKGLFNDNRRFYYVKLPTLNTRDYFAQHHPTIFYLSFLFPSHYSCYCTVTFLVFHLFLLHVSNFMRYNERRRDPVILDNGTASHWVTHTSHVSVT